MGKLPGAYRAVKKDGSVYFRASVTFRGKHISLGGYETEAAASGAYSEALDLMSDGSVSLLSYSPASLLSHDKWVSLVNYRDHGVYFKNPIYLKNTYFQYYLSPSLELKFDIDDLFYYANHKIMRRKGHYFVSDYGMQVNILNRYGIKNYAVPGRDYLFMNNDPTDFRYENIRIINSYNGVRRIDRNGQTLWQAKIHLRGDYLVGTYSSETDAAIAYNKAVDIARKNGFDKNFTQNYIESLSAKEYAERYLGVAVSERLVRTKNRPEPPTQKKKEKGMDPSV